MNQQPTKNFDNFFEIQRYRKRLSWVFFGLFLGVVMLHILALFVVFVLLVGAVTGEMNFSLWLTSTLVFLLILVVGAWMRSHRLSNDGDKLAQKMRAVRLFVSQTDGVDKVQYFSTFIRAQSAKDLPSSYARLYEFCEQMSLASGIALPMIYVLPHEQAVNACVAGAGRHTALIVTQGATDELSNDELYALIAHEYGHILHGDAKFNIRLSIMMAGLSLIYESAEWLEVKLLGEFDADYHKRYSSPQSESAYSELIYNVQFAPDVSLVSFADAKQWLMYTQGRVSLSVDDIKNFRRDAAYMAKDVALMPSLFVMVFLVLYRMIGVFGMASHEWLCQKFNRQREFLADATAVQLTRSFAIADLLKQMTHKFDTRLYSTQVSAFSYFFFLDPRSEDERFFSSHPPLSERIEAVYQHTFFDFSERVALCFDQTVLQQAADEVHEHQPICPLVQEIEALPYFEYAFEEGFETVVDGRLVVDEAWRAGFLEEQVYERYDISINRHDSTTPFQSGQLDWLITKNLRHPIGALCVIQGVLLCRYPALIIHQNAPVSEYHLGDVFIAHPFKDFQDDEKIQMLFNHQMNNDLLEKIAQLPNNHRMSLLIHALKVFRFRLKNPIHKDNKTDELLNKYFNGLLALLGCDSTVNNQIFNKLIFDNQKYKISSALVIVFVLMVLSDYLNKNTAHLLKISRLFVLDFFDESTDDGSFYLTKKQIGFLTLFLCSLQSNYFLINKMDDVIQHTNRALRLMNIPSYLWTAEDVMLSHKMTVQDWSLFIMCLLFNQKTVLNKTILNTWHTVLLQDGHIDDNEKIIDELLKIIFDDE